VKTPTLVLAALLVLPGCALLGKSDPLVPRYFAPEEGIAATPTAPRAELRLRLGRVVGWSHLRERMALRTASHEYVFREDRRWTERPEIYLRRELVRALFEERGLVEVHSGRALTLDVELIAFEEVEQPHEARLVARLALRDDRVCLLEETITRVEPIAKSDPPGQARAVVEALTVALHAGVAQLADRVVAKLATVDPEHAPGEAAPAAASR
jgi:cholesterol transport system auxiliary component